MSKQFTLDLPLSPDAEFSTYVGDAGVRLQTLHHWNVVWGPSGSGRTHLLQAICNQKDDNQNSSSAPDRIYLSKLEKHSPEILKDLESFSIICLDDIDRVIGDGGWQEALFHLLNSAKDANKNVVLAIDKPVQALAIQLADLKSRMMSAVSVVTDDLSDGDKILVLQKRASHWGFELPQEVGQFILSRSPRAMVSLIDNLKRLELETLRAQRKVTIPFAKQTLQL